MFQHPSTSTPIPCSQICKSHQPFKYKIVGLKVLRDTLCRCTEVNNDLNTQLSIIISNVLTPNVACNVLDYFQDGRPMSTGQSQNALPATDSDI